MAPDESRRVILTPLTVIPVTESYTVPVNVPLMAGGLVGPGVDVLGGVVGVAVLVGVGVGRIVGGYKNQITDNMRVCFITTTTRRDWGHYQMPSLSYSIIAF